MYNVLEAFDLTSFRILSATVMLVIASSLDVWKREINDVLWIVFAVISIVLVFFEPNFTNFVLNLGIALIVVPIALLLCRIGIFGGADAFALIVLAALTPQISLTGNTITPFTTLTNAAVFSIVPLFSNLIRNLFSISRHDDIFKGFEETRLRKIFALFLGYRSTNPKFSFPIEKTVDNRKKLNFTLHNAEKAEFCNAKDMWVTPGIPYILYISAGFFVQLFYGDIIFNIMRNIL